MIEHAETILEWKGSEDPAGVEAEIQSGSAPAKTAPVHNPEEKKEAPKAVVATSAAKKVKAPVRELKNKCWNIENYGAEELVFTDAEVMSTHRF